MVTLKEIKKLTYKEHKGFIGIIGKYVGRPISYYLIWFLVPFGITGNQVSLFNILFFIVPFILISIGNRNLAIIGTSLLVFLCVLDYVDGGLARYYRNKTLKGRYLEHLFHELCVPALFFALGVYSFKYFGNYYFLLLGVATMFCAFLMNVVGSSKYKILLRHFIQNKDFIRKFSEHQLVDMNSKNPFKKTLFRIISAFNSMSYFFFILFFLSIFGVLQYAILFYGASYIIMATMKFYIEIRRGFKDYGVE